MILRGRRVTERKGGDRSRGRGEREAGGDSTDFMLLALKVEERSHQLMNAGSFQRLEKARKQDLPPELLE